MQAAFLLPLTAPPATHNAARPTAPWHGAKRAASRLLVAPISTASTPPAAGAHSAASDAQAAASLVLGQHWAAGQAGDERAYCEALRLLAMRLRAYLRHRLMSAPHEVEDLVQETLLALHLQRGTHDSNVPVAAWALAIARHKLIDHWRRHGRREALHDPLDDVDETQLAAVTDPGEARRDLGELMQVLPTAQRQAIELTKIEGLSVAEAAQRTGCSVAAIKVQVHRGLKRLAAAVRSSAASGAALSAAHSAVQSSAAPSARASEVWHAD